jgi:hypothetical protein
MAKLKIHPPMQLNKFIDDEKNNFPLKEYLVYFDVCFRMAATVNANSIELAVDKIHDYSERELLNFDERDAPEITIYNIF